jgi:hypothetical protein
MSDSAIMDLGPWPLALQQEPVPSERPVEESLIRRSRGRPPRAFPGQWSHADSDVGGVRGLFSLLALHAIHAPRSAAVLRLPGRRLP